VVKAPAETVVAAPLVAPLEVPAVQPPLPLQPAPPPVVRQEVVATKPAVKATGTLFLAISPWGRVSVDGRAVGVAPPLTQLTLPEGKHTVTIKNDESPVFTQSIQVEAGQGVTVTHAF
jgi:serine/threonine-protein kinase